MTVVKHGNSIWGNGYQSAVMHHLMTGICSEKHVNRWFHHCVNIIKYTHTNWYGADITRHYPVGPLSYMWSITHWNVVIWFMTTYSEIKYLPNVALFKFLTLYLAELSAGFSTRALPASYPCHHLLCLWSPHWHVSTLV